MGFIIVFFKMIADLFKTDSQRKFEEEEKRREEDRRLRREQNARKRTIQEAIAEEEGQVLKLEHGRERLWNNALELMKSGRESAARDEVKKYRAFGLLIEQLQKKAWILQFFLIRQECASNNATLIEALRASLDNLLITDPNETLGVLDDVQAKLDDATEIDRIWERAFAGEMRNDSLRDSETFPNVDELMDELEKEAADEVAGRFCPSASAAEKEEIARGAAEGRDKLDKIIKGAVSKAVAANPTQPVGCDKL